MYTAEALRAPESRRVVCWVHPTHPADQLAPSWDPRAWALFHIAQTGNIEEGRGAAPPCRACARSRSTAAGPAACQHPLPPRRAPPPHHSPAAPGRRTTRLRAAADGMGPPRVLLGCAVATPCRALRRAGEVAGSVAVVGALQGRRQPPVPKGWHGSESKPCSGARPGL